MVKRKMQQAMQGHTGVEQRVEEEEEETATDGWWQREWMSKHGEWVCCKNGAYRPVRKGDLIIVDFIKLEYKGGKIIKVAGEREWYPAKVINVNDGNGRVSVPMGQVDMQLRFDSTLVEEYLQSSENDSARWFSAGVEHYARQATGGAERKCGWLHPIPAKYIEVNRLEVTGEHGKTTRMVMVKEDK